MPTKIDGKAAWRKSALLERLFLEKSVSGAEKCPKASEKDPKMEPLG